MTMRAMLDVPMHKDDDNVREDVLLSVLAVLFERRMHHDEIKILDLHQCWKVMIDFLATVGVSAEWLKRDPVMPFWPVLDKTISKLISNGCIGRSAPISRGRIIWCLTPKDESKFLSSTGHIYPIVQRHANTILHIYRHASLPPS